MFQRDVYLKELINKKQNHLVKVITGIRRGGKSYLLNKIFYDYLIEKENVPNDHIIKFAFDNYEDIALLDKYLSDQPTVIEKNNQKIVYNRKPLLYIKDLGHRMGILGRLTAEMKMSLVVRIIIVTICEKNML